MARFRIMRKLAEARLACQEVMMKLPLPLPKLSSGRPDCQETSPPLDLKTALENEIPVARAVQTINRMLEATRITADGTTEQDWSAVEAGLRLYFEFTQQGNTAGTASGASPAYNAAFPLTLRNRAKSNRQKQPLSRQIEDEDALQNFMRFDQSAGTGEDALDNYPDFSEYAVRWRQRREEEPDPYEPVCPVVARKNDYRLAMLSTIAIAGLLGILGGVFVTRNPTEISPPHTVAVAGATMPLTPAQNPGPEEPRAPAPTGIAAFAPRFETKMW